MTRVRVEPRARFYSRFGAIVLLSAPLDVILARVAARDTNPYGTIAAERAEIACTSPTSSRCTPTGAACFA